MTLVSFFLLLGLHLPQHLITLQFCLRCFLLLGKLLLAFYLKLFLCVLKNATVKLVPFLDLLFAKLLPQFDLLLQHVSHLLDLLLRSLLLPLHLLLMKALAELLDLAPLVIANVGG